MGNDINAYRAAIGCSAAKSFGFCSMLMSTLIRFLLVCLLTSFLYSPPSSSLKYHLFKKYVVTITTNFLYWLFIFSLINRLLLLISGLESNPGPQPPKFSFATFNVDSLLARDGCKLASIEAIDSVYKFDLFGISETYLNNY